MKYLFLVLALRLEDLHDDLLLLDQEGAHDLLAHGLVGEDAWKVKQKLEIEIEIKYMKINILKKT